MSAHPDPATITGEQSERRPIGRARTRIAVVGGGISGLAAAHRLTESAPSAEVSLYESSDRLGGVLSTELVDGFCIEQGPDSMLTQLPWGVDLCRRIGFADELIGTSSEFHKTWIVRAGKLVPLPEGLAIMAPRRLWPLIRSPILSFPGLLRLACEYFVPQRNAPADESLAAFACRRVGREAFERLVQPLVSGIYMADPDKLSMQAAMPRFVAMESEHGSLIRAARRNARRASAKAPREDDASVPASMFVAPRGGMESMIHAVAERLPQGTIHLQSNVTGLARRPDDTWQLSGQTAGVKFERTFDAVILATPSGCSARLLRAMDDSLADELSQIEQSGCVVVTLAFRREDVAHPLDGYGFVVPLVEQRDVIACTFSSVKYAHRAPVGQVLLRVFLGGAMRPDLMELDDEAALDVVLRELKDLVGVDGRPTLTRLTRWPGVMPQYHLGHLDRMSRIDEAAERLPGLELAGNSYRGVGIPHCIRSGEAAAERVLSGAGDVAPAEPA